MSIENAPPAPSIPAIPVHFVYCDAGAIQRQYRALCTTVPREGEIIFPEAGSQKVIVHVVCYRSEIVQGGAPTMIPTVFLRELTHEETEKVGSIHG